MITKTPHTHLVAVGDCITYTIQVSNPNHYDIEDIIISDTLGSSLEFVAGSLKFNGNASQSDIVAGIKIGSLKAREFKVNMIVFEARVLYSPLEKVVTNSASGTYSYTDTVTGKKQFGVVKSIPCSVGVLYPNLDIIKSQSSPCAKLGDTIYYMLTLINSGDVDLVNILVQDPLCSVLQIMPGSIRLNDQVIHIPNLNQGINIPIIEVGETKYLSFEVIVCGGSSEEVCCNTASAMTTYVLPDQTIGTRCFVSNTVELAIDMRCFKQLLVQKHLLIPPHNSNLDEIDEVTAQVKIIEQYVITTPTGTSCEGQILTGRKLVVNGVLAVDMSYITNTSVQSVHFVHYDLPFSTFMILPVDYKDRAEVGVIGVVENIYCRVNDLRSFYMSIALLIQGKVLK